MLDDRVHPITEGQAFCQSLLSTWFCGLGSICHHESEIEVVGELAYRTLSSNLLKVSQHEGAELFDSLPVAGRARETYP